MKIKKIAATLGVLTLGVWGSPMVSGDEVRYEDRDGVHQQVTTRMVPRTVSETRYEQHETTVLRERYATDMHEVQRTVQVPITEQHWVPGVQRSLNPFAQPVMTYRLMPVTRWETRLETVRVPVTRREVVPEKQTQHIPVTTQRIVHDQHESRVTVGPSSASGTSTIANNSSVGGSVGGTRLEGDPPRDNNNTSELRGTFSR